ncbi:hypothetical protein L0244_25260 [bacterium]|nr:hypothetical protein [bacterium]
MAENFLSCPSETYSRLNSDFAFQWELFWQWADFIALAINKPLISSLKDAEGWIQFLEPKFLGNRKLSSLVHHKV